MNRTFRFRSCNGTGGFRAMQGSEWNFHKWEGAMKSTIRLQLLILMLASSLTLCFSASAQQAMPSDAKLLRTYNTIREISLVGNVVKIGFGKARRFHAACFDVFPAEFLRRRDLRLDGVARFVADAGEDHNFNLTTEGDRLTRMFFAMRLGSYAWLFWLLNHTFCVGFV